MAKDECKTLLDALNKVSACYRHLVVCVGGAADSHNLREELRQTRRKAQMLAVANRNGLSGALQDRRVGGRDRAEFERLWVLFSTCVEILEVDMRRALELGQEFPLNVPRRPLIRSGVCGATAPVAARAMRLRVMKYDGGHDLDTADLSDLEREIDEVGEMLHEMEMRVHVPRWTVAAAGAQLRCSVGASSVGAGLGGGGGGGEMLCGLRKLLAGALFAAVLLVAVALVACVVQLA